MVINICKTSTKKIIDEHVTKDENFLWHIFTWGEVPCEEGEEARKAFEQLRYEKVLLFKGGYSNTIEDVEVITGKFKTAELEKEGDDIYIVATDFSWTFVCTHESTCGPFFYKIKQKSET